MRFKTYAIKKSWILIMAYIICTIIILFFQHPFVHVGSMIAFAFVAIAMVDFDILHPYFWFSSFFCLYTVAFPILEILEYTYMRAIYQRETMLWSLGALLVALLVITPEKKINYEIEKRENGVNRNLLNKLLFLVLISSLLVVAYTVKTTGYTGKMEIYNSGNSILIFAFKIPLILTMLYTLMTLQEWNSTRTISWIKMLIVGGTLLLIVLLSGERDFIFRFVLVVGFMLYSIGKLKFKHFVLMVPVLFLSVPLSTMFKYYFTRGEIKVINGNIVTAFLSSDFLAAGNNLQVVLDADLKGELGFGRILLDFLEVIFGSITSSTAWFNNIFYYGRPTSYGFSLVAEGYVIGGVLGIILLFTIVGLLTRFFYMRCTRNSYWMAAYLYFIPTIIYSFRADLSSITTALANQIGLVILIIYCLDHIKIRK